MINKRQTKPITMEIAIVLVQQAMISIESYSMKAMKVNISATNYDEKEIRTVSSIA